MSEHKDLELLRALRSAQQHDQLKQATGHHIDERPNHARPPELEEGEAIEPPAINRESSFRTPRAPGAGFTLVHLRE
jgi:hypothetical protein